MKFRMEITSQNSQPKTLADVDEGIACLDSEGSITWRSGLGVMYCTNGGAPRVRVGSLETRTITEVLGPIKITWGNDG